MKPSEATDLAELLAATADGGFAIDAEGRIVLWNRAAESCSATPSARWSAAGAATCSWVTTRTATASAVAAVTSRRSSRAGTPVHSFDMRTRTKSGSTIWVNVSTLRVSSDESGDRTVHLIRDVTTTREILALIRERLATPAPPPPAPPDGSNGALTRREIEILHLIASGLNTKDTAERLHVSPATVRNHVQNILGKLGAHSRLEAVAYANRHRLI